LAEDYKLKEIIANWKKLSRGFKEAHKSPLDPFPPIYYNQPEIGEG